MAVETIVAPITAPGLAAVGIVRVSGSQTQEITKKLCVQSERILRAPRVAILSSLLDLLAEKGSAQELDSALAIFFPAPKSFTGEDILEYHVHGSSFVIRRLIENIIHLGARLAKPGEFTERAFHNGRIDLSQAEAVADLIASETEAQARVAHSQLRGNLSHAVSDIGDPLRNLLAEIEAHIDFPEEDIDPALVKTWTGKISLVSTQIYTLLSTFSFGRIQREGARVVLVGHPNVGKSSLLNALLGEERAIVTPIPGTTRDSIEERISLQGIAIRLFDTAGLAEDSAGRKLDPVEALGIERSWKEIREADLVLFVLDATLPAETSLALFEKIKKQSPKIIVVANKIDLCDAHEKETLQSQLEATFGQEALFISAQKNQGLSELRQGIVLALSGNMKSYQGSVLLTTQRHFIACERAHAELTESLQLLGQTPSLEILSVHIRAALSALEDIIGVTLTEDILGRIFSRFCIGK